MPIYPFDSNGRPHEKRGVDPSEYAGVGKIFAKHEAIAVMQVIVGDIVATRDTKALFNQYQAKTLSLGEFYLAVKALAQKLNMPTYLKDGKNDLWLAVTKALIKEFSGKNAWKYGK